LEDPSVLGEVYGVRTPKGVVLIDCGIPGAGIKLLRETLAYFEVDEPITHLLLTHAHWDHCGGAKELQETGVKVVVGQGDAAYCENGGVRGMFTPFDDHHVFRAFKPDVIIAEDTTLEINGLDFEFIPIPGHTPGSTAIRIKIDGKVILFTGDAVQPSGNAQLDEIALGWQGDPGFSRENIVRSMMKLLPVETDIICPGHGKVCLRDGSKILRHAAQYAFMNFR
jgi:glyoxylase-like metal-dependent hydrolase (beta-lactamase superfamily II)